MSIYDIDMKFCNMSDRAKLLKVNLGELRKPEMIPLNKLADQVCPSAEGTFTVIAAPASVGKTSFMQKALEVIENTNNEGYTSFDVRLALINEREIEADKVIKKSRYSQLNYTTSGMGLGNRLIHLEEFLSAVDGAINSASRGRKVVLFTDSVTRVYESLCVHHTVHSTEAGGVNSEAYQSLHELLGNLTGFYRGGGSLAVIGTALFTPETPNTAYTAVANKLIGSSSNLIILDPLVRKYPKISLLSESRVRDEIWTPIPHYWDFRAEIDREIELVKSGRKEW